MSLRKRLFLTAVLGTALTACGSDSTGANASLVGTWTLTKFEFTNIADATQHTDIIALGGHGAIVFNANLTWSVAVTLPGAGGGSFNGSGTYTETATTLTIVTNDQPPETSVFSKTLTSSSLTLTGGTGNFDFGAGDVPSHISITATR